jgi:hypothetical protein
MPVLVAALQLGPSASSRLGLQMRHSAPARVTSLERGLVCETVQLPRRVARRIFVLDTVTRCGEPRSGALDRLEQLCRLDVLAYGAEGGRERCRARLEASPEFRAP